METLLTPNPGLIVWTIVTFFVLVGLLGRYAWRPLIQALSDREARIRQAIEDAQRARQTAEGLQARLEKELAQGAADAQAILQKARADAQALSVRMRKEAEQAAERLMEEAKRRMEEDRAKVIRDLRQDLARLSVQAAEKMVRRTMDAKLQDELLEEFFDQLGKSRSKEIH